MNCFRFLLFKQFIDNFKAIVRNKNRKLCVRFYTTNGIVSVSWI